MKIGFLMQAGAPDVRTAPYSGPANHVRQVFKELAALGHQVKLVACYDGQIVQSSNLETFTTVSVPFLDRGLFHLFARRPWPKCASLLYSGT